MAQQTYPYRYVELHQPRADGPLVVKFVEERSQLVDSVADTVPCYQPELIPAWVRIWAQDGVLPYPKDGE